MVATIEETVLTSYMMYEEVEIQKVWRVVFLAESLKPLFLFI